MRVSLLKEGYKVGSQGGLCYLHTLQLHWPAVTDHVTRGVLGHVSGGVLLCSHHTRLVWGLAHGRTTGTVTTEGLCQRDKHCLSHRMPPVSWVYRTKSAGSGLVTSVTASYDNGCGTAPTLDEHGTEAVCVLAVYYMLSLCGTLRTVTRPV